MGWVPGVGHPGQVRTKKKKEPQEGFSAGRRGDQPHVRTTPEVSQPHARHSRLLAPHATLKLRREREREWPRRREDRSRPGREGVRGWARRPRRLPRARRRAEPAAAAGGGAERASLDGVRDKNVMQLKKLNTALFPVRYNDKYYQDVIASKNFSKLDSFLMESAAVPLACHLEKKEGGAIQVYIMTLGVMAPYRGLGIGTKLLNHVFDLSAKQNIPEIYLHVQTNNEDAITFYKKFGFEITQTIRDYYMNITPPDCYVLTKFISQAATNK